MSQALLPGERWISRNGKHEGGEVEISKITEVSVFFTRRGGGVAEGNQKIDDSRTNRLTREAFVANYTPRESPVGGGGGRAFRRRSAPRAKVVDTRQTVLPISGLISSGGSQLNIEVMDITPLQAQAWLDRGGLNRKPSKRRIERYASEMKRGEWRLTGDSIKLDANSVVRDGQQRLQAIVESGCTVQSLVVRNVTEDAFNVIDTGKTRLAADVLGIHGYMYRIALASAARALLLIEGHGRLNVSSREASELVTNERILTYVQQHERELMEAVHLADNLRSAGLVGGVGLHATLITLLLRKNWDGAHEFVQGLVSGANLGTDDPILRFRNRMINERNMPNSADERETTIAIGIKAWNAWRMGGTLQYLTWRGGRDVKSPEAFPVPV